MAKLAELRVEKVMFAEKQALQAKAKQLDLEIEITKADAKLKLFEEVVLFPYDKEITDHKHQPQDTMQSYHAVMYASPPKSTASQECMTQGQSSTYVIYSTSRRRPSSPRMPTTTV